MDENDIALDRGHLDVDGPDEYPGIESEKCQGHADRVKGHKNRVQAYMTWLRDRDRRVKSEVRNQMGKGMPRLVDVGGFTYHLLRYSAKGWYYRGKHWARGERQVGPYADYAACRAAVEALAPAVAVAS